MSFISKYIILVVSIVLLGVLIDGILPEGKMNKILKSVIAIMSILVIISPLKNIDISNLNLNNFFGGINIDSQFVEDRKLERIESISTSTQKALEENGYKGIKIRLDYTFSNEDLKINTIFVDLKNLVLLDKDLNIDKYTKIVAIIKKTINIKEENIVFYE